MIAQNQPCLSRNLPPEPGNERNMIESALLVVRKEAGVSQNRWTESTPIAALTNGICWRKGQYGQRWRYAGLCGGRLSGLLIARAAGP